jgi:hypothetical protein
MGDPEEQTGRGLLDDGPDERGGIPELLRRVMTVGFSGLFTTEAAIRGALGDTLPREWVDFIAEQSERTRDEFITRLVHEFARVLESVDVVGLAEQLLEGRSVEINAEIRLRPRESEPRPAGDPDAAAQPAEAGGRRGQP